MRVARGSWGVQSPGKQTPPAAREVRLQGCRSETSISSSLNGCRVSHTFRVSTSTSPVVGGWPLLGCLIPFATQGAAFISSCRLQYGDMFQLCLPGQKIVFLFHPDAIQAFFQSPDSKISFRLAVERFTQRLAAMEEAADVVLPCEGEVELMEAVNQILTPAAIKMLFGSAFLEEHGPENVLRAFATFESGFELAASPVPHWLQRGWCKSRAWLLSAFRC
ncbi:hypothetical protein WJX84_003407 [Apatococcus fuscideae]|uniref:Uncharacterized protein n=1 Tax=Apatococcus fuscideae TaxID=2026836 RepID=A0AAW1SS10_9CHLO